MRGRPPLVDDDVDADAAVDAGGGRPARRRLVLAAAVAAVCVGVVAVHDGPPALSREFPAPVPRAVCDAGSRPETGVQGRVPAADYASGRAARGYTCNARFVARQGTSGGFKVLRYVDDTGRACAYYDAAQPIPIRLPGQLTFLTGPGTGVTVLDMARPSRPRVTASLTTPTMLSPHESLLVNQRRGLLAAVMGNSLASVGVLEIYSLAEDCRRPRLLSRTVEPLLGHESGWSNDGRTFYAASTAGQTFTAIDVADPTRPRRIYTRLGVNYHGMRLSADDRTLYVADIGNDLTGLTLPGEGLRILDVSAIQERRPNPTVPVLADLAWPEGSIPQVAQPFERDGRRYVLEVDEFSTVGLNDGSLDVARATVGAARIIEVTDPRRPRILSRIRLEVHQPQARLEAADDPGAGDVFGGYTAHYCSVPTPRDPQVAACSMIGSGLRVFDLSDLRHPREIAYANRPTEAGSAARAQPAWDLARGQIWFSDPNSGFYVVRLTGDAARALRR